MQRYFVPLGVKARLLDMGVPAERVQEFDWWQSGAHAGVRLTATPAQHFSGRSLTDRNRTLWASWVIRERRAAHLLQRRLGLLRRLSGRSAIASAASTWR